ncbi:helix-turn-helix domain-containing protein [Streptomyces sp. SID4946]|uniref:Excisionase n=2 Tax=Streptomyces TaxID=1883 RepID=A0A917Y8D8_9ACTN|nr:helix-turn-helix domain-containing protein [Streptomyces sp. SID4946]MYV47928.1 helix-turn-helix domain-containing protein [Streptomyces sp. SID2888]GGN77542.1 excisionase [Streptomyces albiflavescens]SCF66610.1 Helix-turn-helix domain-containing protein [Streptomyces sp. LamerLS-31b]SCF72764.1 Helix-turn-helix domain-containing protein [Streptomyces sp. DconLS]
MKDEMMTVREVCTELKGISRRTFYRWRELGQAPQAFKLPNGELRVWRSDFNAWLNARERATA